MTWSWSQIEPYFLELNNRQINAENVRIGWPIGRGSRAWFMRPTNACMWRSQSIQPMWKRKKRYDAFLDQIFPKAEAAEQKLKQKLLAS